MPKHDLDEMPTTRAAGADDGTGDRLDDARSAAADALEGAASLARGVPEQVDQVAAGTGRVLGEAQRVIEGGSDDALIAGTALATGLAMGMLVGRAPRLAVALVLLPAAAMGATLLQRRGTLLKSGEPLLN